MRYSVYPARAVWDTRFGQSRQGLVCCRVLAALCCFTNPAGLSWVSQFMLATILDVSLPVVSRAMQELELWGYVKDLGPYKGPRNSRYPTRVKQVRFEADQPPPQPEDYTIPLAANRLLEDSNYSKDSDVSKSSTSVVGIIRHEATETVTNAITQCFIRAVERASGLARDPAASRTHARVLALAGATPQVIEPIVFALAKQAIAAGRMPALHIGQYSAQILAETRKITGSDA